MARIDSVMTRVGMRPLLTPSPTAIDGSPAGIQGSLVAELVEIQPAGSDVFEPAPDPASNTLPGDAASGGQPYLVSSNAAGDVLHFAVKGDRDLNPGVTEFIVDDHFVTITEPGAVNLNSGLGAEVPKPV